MIRSATVALGILALAPSARAVIVAGASGGSDTANNTTRAQLEAELGTPFAGYDNVFQFSDSTGIYLGYDPASSDLWVLTAKHVTNNNNPITIGALAYDHLERVNLGDDLELNRYGRSDNQVPTLPSIQLASTTPSAGQQIVMIGTGRNRVEPGATDASTSDATATGGGTTGYQWSGSRIKRWGTNQVEAEFPDSLEGSNPLTGVLGASDFGGGTTVFFADFDEPGGGEFLTTNEAIVALSDSGGGAFAWNGSEYELVGIFSSVSSFTGQDANTAAFGNGSILTDIASSRAEIVAVTGVLVPEPGSLVLAAGGLLLTLRRRR